MSVSDRTAETAITSEPQYKMPVFPRYYEIYMIKIQNVIRKHEKHGSSFLTKYRHILEATNTFND
jgi:hypothetical protein